MLSVTTCKVSTSIAMDFSPSQRQRAPKIQGPFCTVIDLLSHGPACLSFLFRTSSHPFSLGLFIFVFFPCNAHPSTSNVDEFVEFVGDLLRTKKKRPGSKIFLAGKLLRSLSRPPKGIPGGNQHAELF